MSYNKKTRDPGLNAFQPSVQTQPMPFRSIFDRLICFKSGLEGREIGERLLRLTPRRPSTKAACSCLPLPMNLPGWAHTFLHAIGTVNPICLFGSLPMC
jgi:hypothetical protein